MRTFFAPYSLQIYTFFALSTNNRKHKTAKKYTINNASYTKKGDTKQPENPFQVVWRRLAMLLQS